VACKLLIFNGAKNIGIGHLDFFDSLSSFMQLESYRKKKAESLTLPFLWLG
jgi:hypothetical protein